MADGPEGQAIAAGTRIRLKNGLYAVIQDSLVNDSKRLAEIYGRVTETDFIYLRDIAAIKVADTWTFYLQPEQEKKDNGQKRHSASQKQKESLARAQARPYPQARATFSKPKAWSIRPNQSSQSG